MRTSISSLFRVVLLRSTFLVIFQLRQLINLGIPKCVLPYFHLQIDGDIKKSVQILMY